MADGHSLDDHGPVKNVETVTLWRPTGPQELALVESSGWRAWPPRLPDQPIFYPVLNEDYATMIARDWKRPGLRGGIRDPVRGSPLLPGQI